MRVCAQEDKSQKSSSCSSINNMTRIWGARSFQCKLTTTEKCTEFMHEALMCGIRRWMWAQCNTLRWTEAGLADQWGSRCCSLTLSSSFSLHGGAPRLLRFIGFGTVRGSTAGFLLGAASTSSIHSSDEDLTTVGGVSAAAATHTQPNRSFTALIC